MDLNQYQVGYFIQQVGLSAASFGVTTEDVTAVGMALNKIFGYRCSPPTVVVPSQGPQLESVCVADTCPLAMNATCSMYEQVQQPLVANATLAMGLGTNKTSNGTSSSSSSSKPSAPMQTTNAGAQMVGPIGAVLGAAALALVL